MTWEILGRMLLAVAIGGLIGSERESRDKAAGFRTMTLICLGSALFTIFSIRIGGADDSARIAAQIVSGVGFLGAGAIMRQGPRVAGLTTAATIWLVASLGMGAGSSDWRIALTATGVTLLVLLLFPWLERSIHSRSETETYTVECDRDAVRRLDEMVQASGLRRLTRSVGRQGSTATVTWTLIGRQSAHASLVGALFDDPDVSSLA